MVKKKVKKDTKKVTSCKMNNCNGGGAVYGLGFVGAVIYYVSSSTSFWMGVLGILKAIVWPAFLVFELMKYLSI